MNDRSERDAELLKERVTEREEALRRLFLGVALVSLLLMVPVMRDGSPRFVGSSEGYYLSPLAMRGGDPYIRALMRTISASEANSPDPYSIIYGGYAIRDLSRHPDQCVTIVAGPNRGNCTTAAGRYQMLTSTWFEKAHLYHPQPHQLLFWDRYSFEPEFQDQVVYSWLTDPAAWGADISALLRQGRLNEVLQLLSGTWTSLGYGIEDNAVTPDLPVIYEKVLREELGRN